MMTQTEFDEAVAEEKRRWAIAQEAKRVYEGAMDVWNAVYSPLNREKNLREVRAEIEKEMAAASENKPCTCTTP